MSSQNSFKFSELPKVKRRNIARRLIARRKTFVNLMNGTYNYSDLSGRILLVGDKPGPGAPADPNFHHTPFYSTIYSSGWLNYLLGEYRIDEDRLIWLNASSIRWVDGDFMDVMLGAPPLIEERYEIDGHFINIIDPTHIITLGNLAEAWVKKNTDRPYIKQAHPQYWKRFKSKEEYPLLPLLYDIIQS